MVRSWLCHIRLLSIVVIALTLCDLFLAVRESLRNSIGLAMAVISLSTAVITAIQFHTLEHTVRYGTHIDGVTLAVIVSTLSGCGSMYCMLRSGKHIFVSGFCLATAAIILAAMCVFVDR